MKENFYRINTADPRQDVYKERKHNPGLYRYSAAEKLLPENLTGKKLLDLGGGTGEMSKRMKQRGGEVVFTDLNEASLKRVADQHRIRTVRSDFNDGLPDFANNEFDGVVMLEVIEHIVASEQLVSEICRVLKPGGFLIISTPNFSYLLNRLRILFGHLSVDEGYHYRFFTFHSLKQLLVRTGFKITESYNFAPALGINFVFNKLLKKERFHLKIHTGFSPLFAQTLMISAYKK